MYILDVHGTDKTLARPPRSSRKRKLSNFENPQSTAGRSHDHGFCANRLLFFFFFFLFQRNSEVSNRNQTQTYTYRKPLRAGSRLGAARGRQAARPPPRPLVTTQERGGRTRLSRAGRPPTCLICIPTVPRTRYAFKMLKLPIFFNLCLLKLDPCVQSNLEIFVRALALIVN